MTMFDSSSDSATGIVLDRLQQSRRRTTLIAGLSELYAPVVEDLLAVEEILRREMTSRDAHVDSLLQHGLRLSGKRLRPALLLLVARGCGDINDTHRLLAAVMEMIHTATLVHDDVLDGATVRRHQETINRRAGNATSVLLGDFLFSHAFYLASSVGSSYACQRIGRTTNIVCEGEIRQVESAGDYGVDESRYLGIIEAKTAELCACCCELGAHYADAGTDATDAMREYGRNLGIAFQIVDDVLDVVGDERQMGKSLGTDFEQEKLTLPLIRLLDQSDADGRSRIHEMARLPLSERHVAMHALLEESGAITYARQRAESFATAAVGSLDALHDSPARAALEDLCRFVVARSR